VQMSKMESHLDEIVEVLQKGGLREYIDQLEPLAESDYSPIEIAAALMKMKFEK